MAKYECQVLLRCQVIVTVEAESEHVAGMKAVHEIRQSGMKDPIRCLILPFECVRIERPQKK